MTVTLTLTNAHIVCPDRVVRGTLHVVDGRIDDVHAGASSLSSAIDCAGDLVMPGLVELHTDHIEVHANPRPGVQWPAAAACAAHDSQMIGAGITTVFDALCCGDISDTSTRMATLETLANAITKAQRAGYLRADHRLHLRCEVAIPTVMTIVSTLIDNPLVGIISLMDHTPGQRQFVRLDKYREYYMGKHHYSAEEMDRRIAVQRAMADRHSGHHRALIAALSQKRNLVLATHDDATEDHIAEATALGVHFCEFPTTREAAKAAHAAGMKVLMGSPNLVRGGSHSGNVSAAQLVADGTLDILSSDYVPVSMLHAALMLTRAPHGLPLPQAIATVTATPAAVAGLHDRGAITVGRLADVIRVHDTGDCPVVRSVWRMGRQVA